MKNKSTVIVKPVNENYKMAADLECLIQYICRKDKAIHHLYGSYGIRIDTPKLATQDFLETGRLFDKHPSTLAHHKIISFQNGLLSIPQQAFDIAEEIVAYYTNDFQVVYSVHEDRKGYDNINKNYHIHLVINSVNYNNGKIFHEGPPDSVKFQKYIEKIINNYL